MKKLLKRTLLLLVASALLPSCAAVKAYQKQHLNDAEMSLSARKAEKFELNFLLYREAASGCSGGKNSGGCGCN